MEERLVIHPEDHPLVKRGIFMLNAQIDSVDDLIKYWSLVGHYGAEPRGEDLPG